MVKNTTSSITCRFFTEESFQDILTSLTASKSIVILTENSAGEQYLLASDNVDVLIDEWNGDCDGLPENDAPVHRLWVSGKERELSGRYSRKCSINLRNNEKSRGAYHISPAFFVTLSLRISELTFLGRISIEMHFSKQF